MKEYIDKEACCKNRCLCNSEHCDKEKCSVWLAPAADVVSKDLYEQIKWERDVALAQLEEYGVSLGEKADVVEVRHGRVMVHDGHEDEYFEYCSECGTMDIHSGDNYCPNCGCKMDKEELIEYAPVRHGRWMPYSTTMMICSVCERHTAKHRFEYCPHCGCKMDKEE